MLVTSNITAFCIRPCRVERGYDTPPFQLSLLRGVRYPREEMPPLDRTRRILCLPSTGEGPVRRQPTAGRQEGRTSGVTVTGGRGGSGKGHTRLRYWSAGEGLRRCAGREGNLLAGEDRTTSCTGYLFPASTPDRGGLRRGRTSQTARHAARRRFLQLIWNNTTT